MHEMEVLSGKLNFINYNTNYNSNSKSESKLQY